jgi:Zn-dependent protease
MDPAGALAAWRRALELLPASARQRAVVTEKVAQLSKQVPAERVPAQETPGWLRKLGPVGVAGFGLWKLVGVAKFAAVASLFASFGVYWQAWGWKFAAGFLGSLYLHELGHVVALRRAGIPASLPMFIPGVGAFIRMHSAPPDARTDCRVGLAGPLAGLLVALVFYGLSVATASELLRAIAHTGAVLNLFNLIPVWQLDGSRGFASLAQWQRMSLVALAGVLVAVTHEGILWLILIVGVFRALSPKAPAKADVGGMALFSVILGALSFLSLQAR